MKRYTCTIIKTMGAGQRLELTIGKGQMAGKHSNSSSKLVIKGTALSVIEDGRYY